MFYSWCAYMDKTVMTAKTGYEKEEKAVKLLHWNDCNWHGRNDKRNPLKYHKQKMWNNIIFGYVSLSATKILDVIFSFGKGKMEFQSSCSCLLFRHGAQLLITSWLHNNYQLVIFRLQYPRCGINCWIQMYLHGLHAEINWNIVTILCSEIMFTFGLLRIRFFFHN